jgi:hypothetical protein
LVIDSYEALHTLQVSEPGAGSTVTSFLNLFTRSNGKRTVILCMFSFEHLQTPGQGPYALAPVELGHLGLSVLVRF